MASYTEVPMKSAEEGLAFDDAVTEESGVKSKHFTHARCLAVALVFAGVFAIFGLQSGPAGDGANAAEVTGLSSKPECEKPSFTDPGDVGAWSKESPCSKGLFADNEDGSIRSYNIILTDKDKAFLDNAPKAEKWAPCDIVINHGSKGAATISGAKCRYKGSTGSFLGCLNEDGSRAIPAFKKIQGQVHPCRKMSWKVKLPKGKSNREPAMGAKVFQFLGIQHDDSMLKNRLSYAVLNDAGFVAPCAAPANIYINGMYDGIYDNIENPDEEFIRKRPALAITPGRGGGTLYKETWPSNTDPTYYDNLQAIPGLASPGIKVDGDGPHSKLFADLAREAETFVQDCGGFPESAPGNPAADCGEGAARKILDRYVDSESYINGLVGGHMVANWDQPANFMHNFYVYIKDDKLFFVLWDFNEAFGQVSMKYPFLPKSQEGFPWWHPNEKDCKEKAKLGGFLGQLYNGTMPCHPVGQLMAKAWKQQFFDTMARVSEGAFEKAEAHVARWNAQTGGAISCDAKNGGWPTVAVQEKAAQAIVQMFRKILAFYKAVSDGTKTYGKADEGRLL